MSDELRLPKKSQAGFTLIELLVVIGLIAVISVFALPNISAVFKASLRSAARAIATTSKETFNATAMTGKVHRLVFDLDKDEYWAEIATADTIQLDSEKSRELAERRRKFGMSQEDEEEEKKKKNPFSLAKNVTRKKVSLPRGVEFDSIETEQSKEPITEGVATMHFFPHGISEQTLLHLKDTSKHDITLHISPILGRVRLIEGKVSLKEALEGSE